MPTIPLSTPGLSHVLQIRKAPPAATIQKLIEECHASLIAKRGCDADITRVLALFGLDYLMAAGGRQGTVDGAASLPIRLDILLKASIHDTVVLCAQYIILKIAKVPFTVEKKNDHL